MRIFLSVLPLIAACAMAAATGPVEAAVIDRLYILNCGEGVAGDISRWSPGVNVGKKMDFADNCYLLRHGQAWMLWDTGITDDVAKMPDGLPSPDPRAVHWYRPKTLAGQLEELGVKPGDIGLVGVSHTHPDHIGNVELFPHAILLVQKAEYVWPDASGKSRFNTDHPAVQIEGDYDVFGDGSVTVISTPGHTPGHQSLLVRLANTGAIVLSGDVVHFCDNWDNRRVPPFNTDQNQSAASMERIAGLLRQDKAQLWINHDRATRDISRMSPAYYD